MNRTKIIETSLEYLKTILFTLLITFIITIGLLKLVEHNAYQELLAQKVEDNSIDYNSIEILIQKYNYLETQQPDNYKIDLKLGGLYEVKKDYKNAEIEYQKAISKAPYDEYKPKYKLALLYTQLNLFDNAQALMDKIEEEPDKKLIGYKADVYKQLGDKYYNMGDYENAIEHYEKSLSYWEILKNNAEIKYAKDSLASSYVYLAEIDLDNMQPDDAINALKMAQSIVDAPILRYKLALLLMNENPELAYQYLEEVFKKEPDIINYEEASKFLSKLADDAYAEGNPTQGDLYRYNIKELKDYFKVNVLSIDDLAVDDAAGKITLNKFTKKYKINLEFRLKNTSKSNIDSLFLNVVFKNGNKGGTDVKNEIIDTYSEKIVDKKSILGIGFYSPIINIKTFTKQTTNDKSPKEITAEIYVSKTPKTHKLLLTTIGITEQTTTRHISKFVKDFAFFFQKIMSKLPAFLF